MKISFLKPPGSNTPSQSKHVESKSQHKDAQIKELVDRDELQVVGGDKNRNRGWKTLPDYQKGLSRSVWSAPKRLTKEQVKYFFDLNGPTTNDDAEKLAAISFARQEKRYYWIRESRHHFKCCHDLIIAENFRLRDFPSFGRLPQSGEKFIKTWSTDLDFEQIHFLGDLDISDAKRPFKIPPNTFVEGSLLATNAKEIRFDESVRYRDPIFFEVGGKIDLTGYRGEQDSLFMDSWLKARRPLNSVIERPEVAPPYEEALLPS